MPHVHSDSAPPLANAPDGDVRERLKLEGGKQLVMQTEFQPAGDQPTAIKELSEAIHEGERNQVLLGATGTGKTYTMAKVIEQTQRPAIILAPTKPSPPSFTASSKASSRTMRSNTSSRSTTTTSPRRMSRAATPTSKKKARLTNKSTGCATRPPAPCWNAMT